MKINQRKKIKERKLSVVPLHGETERERGGGREREKEIEKIEAKNPNAIFHSGGDLILSY